MTDSIVNYALENGVATITMDDGKRNALSPRMFRELNIAFDRAEKDNAIIILTGRDETFSAGFDLKVMKGGNAADTLNMLRAGFSMTARLLAYPRPVITACNGNALAMGLFLMLSTDYRIGVAGAYKFAANEVAIGLVMPRTAVEVLQLRLTPAAFQRAVVLSEYFSPDNAVEAGILDEVVTRDALMATALEKARQFDEQLDARAHELSKLRIRDAVIRRIRRAVPLDLKDALMLGVRAMVKSATGR